MSMHLHQKITLMPELTLPSQMPPSEDAHMSDTVTHWAVLGNMLREYSKYLDLFCSAVLFALENPLLLILT